MLTKKIIYLIIVWFGKETNGINAAQSETIPINAQALLPQRVMVAHCFF